MTTRVYYVIGVPESAEDKGSGSGDRRVSEQGAVGSGSPHAESVASNPDEKSVGGWLRGLHADRGAEELRELWSAGEIDTIPYRGEGGTLDDRGYYVLKDITVTPPEPRLKEYAQQFDATMVRKGTRQSHWRAVRTNPIVVDNDFSGDPTDTTGYVGLPAEARKVRWFRPEDEAREEAEVVETREAEHGDVELYDSQESSFDQPVLIYDLPYDREGAVDCVLWDDFDEPKTASTTDDGYGMNYGANYGGGVRYANWHRVYDPRHEWGGNPRTSNGLLRVQWDEDNQAMLAERWDTGAYTWREQELGDSSWELFDFDVTSIGMPEIAFQVEFRDPSQDPTAYYSLDGTLKRGYEGIQWIIPPNESGPVPDGLRTLLAPIANESVTDPQESQTLIDRQEVRR